MARSTDKRRARYAALELGAPRKPPETYQPSERAAEVRVVMAEEVADKCRVMLDARRRVRMVQPTEPPASPVRRTTIITTHESLGLAAPNEA